MSGRLRKPADDAPIAERIAWAQRFPLRLIPFNNDPQELRVGGRGCLEVFDARVRSFVIFEEWLATRAARIAAKNGEVHRA